MNYRYQRIYTSIWYDEKFRRLSEDGQRLFLYLLTSPHSTILGLYFLPKVYILGDLKWDDKRLGKPFEELLKEGLIEYDDHTHLLHVKNHLKHNPIHNANQVTAALKLVPFLPTSSLFMSYISQLNHKDKPYLKPLSEQLRRRIENRSPNCSGKTEAETEAEIESEKETEEGSLSPPDGGDPPPPAEGSGGKGKVSKEAPSPIIFRCSHLEIEEEYFSKLLSEYPGLTPKLLKREISKAADWLTDNPGKHKRNVKGQIKNPKSFLRRWIERIEIPAAREGSYGKTRSGSPDPKGKPGGHSGGGAGAGKYAGLGTVINIDEPVGEED